jgi:hypothetical protein
MTGCQVEVEPGRAHRLPRKAACALASALLAFVATPSHADSAQLSGRVTWGQRAICDRAQGRKLVFAGDAGKAEAAVGQDGYYSVSLAPGRYRVTLRCGGTDIESRDVIGYPTPTRQDLAF